MEVKSTSCTEYQFLVLAIILDSRFEILTRDEPLGQRAELLRYAALPGERVTVGVTQGMQTAIVESGAEPLLNFNYFFRQASRLLSTGDPQQQITATIRRQPLDESGKPLPGVEEEVLSPSQGRIEVSVDRASQQYYVRIAGASIQDNGVYRIEVCSQVGTPEEACLNANTTLFVLDGELVSLSVINIKAISLSYHTGVSPFVSCEDSISLRSILLRCQNIPFRIISSTCSIDGQPAIPCTLFLSDQCQLT